ncbi:MAG: superoxide dismutase family protein [Burkholderiales bacterium]
MKSIIAAAAALAVLAGGETVPPHSMRASAPLQPTTGNKASGEVTFEEAIGKVRIRANVQGLAPGREHGFHIHEVGDCSANAENAKGHFNPDGKPHGHFAAAERHAGDLPALRADDAGRGQLDTTVDRITLTPAAASIIGRAVVVHADPDDYKTQPAGNSGARIACGVIRGR